MYNCVRTQDLLENPVMVAMASDNLRQAIRLVRSY
jgi:hypothetical protein